jgi:hypothetical protein
MFNQESESQERIDHPDALGFRFPETSDREIVINALADIHETVIDSGAVFKSFDVWALFDGSEYRVIFSYDGVYQMNDTMDVTATSIKRDALTIIAPTIIGKLRDAQV